MRPVRPRGRRPGWIRVLLWLILLLGSLSLVTWRQTRGLVLERELREVETRRTMAETERVELVRQVERLRSRSRVMRVARERLGMHLPQDHEIVFLPVEAGAPSAKEGAP